ncbi:hypothetical protein Q7P37_011254 [Cladosporium fusiforme]
MFRARAEDIGTKPQNLIQEKMREEAKYIRSEERRLQKRAGPLSLSLQVELDGWKAKHDSTIEVFKTLSDEKATDEQITSLNLAKAGGPNFLGRTASMTRGCKFGQYHRRTNGMTAHDVLLPSADVRKGYVSHQHMTDLSQGELKYMIGNHLMWKDLKGDEFLSYSKDALFLVVHTLRRHHEDQGDVTIQILDRRKAKTLSGDPAAFYNALDMYTTFEVPKWSGWSGWADSKFTQEFLTHGPIFYGDPMLKQARVRDLIRDGLYDIFPDFEAPENHKRAGLYTLQVVLRKIGYPPPESRTDGQEAHIYSYDECSRIVPMTAELLGIVRKVTLNFSNIPLIPDGYASQADPDFQPSLHIFISFLTFEKRMRREPAFESWIKQHYTAQDVTDLYTNPEGHVLPGFTTVANNLPGYMQYVDLVRDCINIFQPPPLPPNAVETAHAFDGMMTRSYTYADYDAKQHWDDVKSELYSAEAHEEAKAKRRKRRAITVGKAEDGDDPDDDAHDNEIEDACGGAGNSGLLMESAIQVRKKSDSQGDGHGSCPITWLGF